MTEAHKDDTLLTLLGVGQARPEVTQTWGARPKLLVDINLNPGDDVIHVIGECAPEFGHGT